MKMKSAKLMTLMTAVALGVFSGGNVMAAGNGDFYMQPPADSGWQKANTEGAYASYTNGSDYINVYKYSAVSYTHLDVYKRQVLLPTLSLPLSPDHSHKELSCLLRPSPVYLALYG